MNDRDLRIGIIGIGRAGNTHLNAWQLVPRAHVVAIADPCRRATERAASAGARVYTDSIEMMEHERLDGVCVCTPPADHVDASTAALEHGVHVLSEEPLALNSRDALKLLRVADMHERVLLLARNFRHVPGLRAAHDLIASGRLGEPVSFGIRLCSFVDMARRWNSDPTRSGGGVIMDAGARAIDIAGMLCGPVTKVQASLLNPLQDLEVEDSAIILMRTGDNIVGRAEISWSLDTGQDSYVTVYCSRGVLDIGWRTGRLKLHDQGWSEIAGGYDELDSYRRMLCGFANLLANDGGTRPPVIDRLECMRSVAEIEATYRSLDSGRWEPVDVDIEELTKPVKREAAAISRYAI